MTHLTLDDVRGAGSLSYENGYTLPIPRCVTITCTAAAMMTICLLCVCVVGLGVIISLERALSLGWVEGAGWREGEKQREAGGSMLLRLLRCVSVTHDPYDFTHSRYRESRLQLLSIYITPTIRHSITTTITDLQTSTSETPSPTHTYKPPNTNQQCPPLKPLLLPEWECPDRGPERRVTKISLTR